MLENIENSAIVLFLEDRPPCRDRIGILKTVNKQNGTCQVEFENGTITVFAQNLYVLYLLTWGTGWRWWMDHDTASLLDKLTRRTIEVERWLRPFKKFQQIFFGTRNTREIALKLGVLTIMTSHDPPSIGPIFDIREVCGHTLFDIRCLLNENHYAIGHGEVDMIPILETTPKDEVGIRCALQDVLAQKIRLVRAMTLFYASQTGTQVNLETR